MEKPETLHMDMEEWFGDFLSGVHLGYMTSDTDYGLECDKYAEGAMEELIAYIKELEDYIDSL